MALASPRGESRCRSERIQALHSQPSYQPLCTLPQLQQLLVLLRERFDPLGVAAEGQLVDLADGVRRRRCDAFEKVASDLKERGVISGKRGAWLVGRTSLAVQSEACPAQD